MKKSLLPVCQLVLMTLASLSGLEAAPAAAAAADKENEKPGIASTKNFEAECLRQHNKWRRLHRASPLKIDAKVSGPMTTNDSLIDRVPTLICR